MRDEKRGIHYPKLSEASRQQSKRNLIDFDRVRRRYRLTKADAGRLIGVTRNVVDKWYAGRMMCPDTAARTIESEFKIRGAIAVREDLTEMKKRQ